MSEVEHGEPAQGASLGKEFARILRASDGEQVLVYETSDEKGLPALRAVTRNSGVNAEMTFTLLGASMAERLAKRSERLHTVGVPFADQIRGIANEALKEGLREPIHVTRSDLDAEDAEDDENERDLEDDEDGW